MRVVIFGESDIGLRVKSLYPDTTIVAKNECDVRDAFSVNQILKRINPDLIVNCAGISHVQRCLNSKIDDWREEMEVNLFGSYLIAREALSVNPNIKMIFIASVAGLYGKAEHSGYSASKAAVISLVQSLGMEGHDAYAISPGRVDTKMREKDFPGEDKRTRLTTLQVAEVVMDCVNGVYQPGDNVIVRKRGFRSLQRIDKGQPWREYLNVQPIGTPKSI
jgi:NAD(P)-dependent dehydrogenase (short-subunit alcohol dehydrogenase family)